MAGPTDDSKAKVEGYMGRSVEIDHVNRTIDLEPFEYDGTFYSDEKMAEKGFDPTERLGVRILQCYHEGKRIPTPTRPEMKGISGGAIWSVQPNFVRLVGIVNEYHPGAGLLLGVKLGVIARAFAARLGSEGHHL